MPDCNKCIWSTRSGNCVSWECKFVSYEDARKALERKQPEIIFCHECRYWKDSDGVYRRGICAESKCPVNSQQVYEGTFFCGMAKKGEPTNDEVGG